MLFTFVREKRKGSVLAREAAPRISGVMERPARLGERMRYRVE
jgi:hypothetical protein